MAVQLSISLPEDLLKIIDERARKEHVGRSEAIKKMLLESLEKSQQQEGKQGNGDSH